MKNAAPPGRQRSKRRVALVTGASTGIGRAIALTLAQEGVSIAVNYAGKTDAANETLDGVRAAGSDGMAIAADVSDFDQVHRMIAECHAHFGKLDIIVNNAGISTFKPLAAVDVTEFEHLFGVNTRGPFFVTQAAAALIPEGGRIVNISSSFAQHALFPACSVYAGSKAAVEGFTRAWAVELGERGITVNAVAPGLTDTPLMRQASPAGVADAIAKRSPFGRLGEPQDIADVVAFLCSEAARWITGQIIPVHGGAIP